MAHFSFLESHDGMLEIFRHDIDRLRPLGLVAQNLMRGPSELSPGVRELIGAYVSGLNGCAFCYGSHRAVAESFEVDPETIDRLVSDGDVSILPPRLRPLIVLAGKLTRDLTDVGQVEIDAVTEAGWTEETAQDVVCIASLFALFNRLTMGHGVVGSQEYFAREAAMLGPGGGYV